MVFVSLHKRKFFVHKGTILFAHCQMFCAIFCIFVFFVGTVARPLSRANAVSGKRLRRIVGSVMAACSKCGACVPHMVHACVAYGARRHLCLKTAQKPPLVIECKFFTEKSIDLFVWSAYYFYLCNIQAAVAAFAEAVGGAWAVLRVKQITV